MMQACHGPAEVPEDSFDDEPEPTSGSDAPATGAPKPKKKARKAGKKVAKKKTKAPAKKKAPTGKGPSGRIGKHGKQIADGRRKPGTNPPRSEAARRFGKAVARARAAKGMSQLGLSVKIGITQPGLANIERGVGGGSKEETVKAINKALGLKLKPLPRVERGGKAKKKSKRKAPSKG